MGKVQVADPLASNCFSLGKGASKVQAVSTMKRKTPSELRGEQLKRRHNGRAHESLDLLPVSDGTIGGKVNGLKKTELSKGPKYIDTRVDEVYPVRKSSNMFKTLSGKENSKGTSPSGEQPSNKSTTVACNISPKNPSQFTGEKDGAPRINGSTATSVEDSMEKTSQKNDKCSQIMFRSVAELSLGREMLSGRTIVDMDKALKGLVARELPVTSQLPDDSNGRLHDLPSTFAGNFCAEVHIPGCKTPLDFTLKTTMRLISSSPVSWCHRLSTSGSFSVMTQFASQFGWLRDQNTENLLQPTSTAEVLYSKSLHSWSYPQSSLPSSLISALTLSTARGETDFLLKRQLAWEDSFRSLYYMLRKNICDIFYVYTSQFVVMFIGGNFIGETKHSCNAYLSQSTRGLRSLLQENGICFSMPLCHSEVEQVTAEDLVELSEIEKSNLGQTRHLDSMSNVDNSPQSLLAFIGNENVHGLYDFLLNYRSFLSSLTGIDVPVLYSPVPFEHASLSAPEVRCKEVKKADAVLHFPKGSDMVGGFQGSSAGICYSVEIKDAILPPWTICGVCAAMGSEGRSYEASFVTEPNSIGLNAAIGAVSGKYNHLSESCEVLPGNSAALPIPEASLVPCLQSGFLRRLKYSNGSYMASLSPV